MQKTKVTKPSEIFLFAAKLLLESHTENEKPNDYLGGCDAIQCAFAETFSNYDPLEDDIRDQVKDIWDMFSPYIYCVDYWFGIPWETPNTHERVMCLLLASAYAESIGQ